MKSIGDRLDHQCVFIGKRPRKARVLPKRLKLLVRPPKGIGQNCFGQRKGRCSGRRARHIGDAIMRDSVLDEHGMTMTSRLGCLDATTLVDTDIHHRRSLGQ